MDDHPRKRVREGRDKETRPSLRRAPFAFVGALAMVIIVGTLCAFVLGVGARMAYELFQVGWNLFGY